MWLPSHVVLDGNVSAVAAAMAALNLLEAQIPVLNSDFYPLINSHIYSRWQQLWNSEINNKLHGIEPMVKSSKPFHLPQRDELIIHGVLIEHTHLNHAFLLKREEPPSVLVVRLL
jgi:hypothetical protein